MAGWSVWHKLSNPTGRNLTYAIQVKDQIGSYFYFPSLGMHKAAGAFGGIRIWSRPQIPVPFPPPAGDFTILAGDWFKLDHRVNPLHLFLSSLHPLLITPLILTLCCCRG